MGRNVRKSLGRPSRNGAVMNGAIIDRIVKAVLYEGYMLYPLTGPRR